MFNITQATMAERGVAKPAGEENYISKWANILNLRRVLLATPIVPGVQTKPRLESSFVRFNLFSRTPLGINFSLGVPFTKTKTKKF